MAYLLAIRVLLPPNVCVYSCCYVERYCVSNFHEKNVGTIYMVPIHVAYTFLHISVHASICMITPDFLSAHLETNLNGTVDIQ